MTAESKPTVDPGLSKLVFSIAEQLLPGWKIRFSTISREAMDQITPGALAICKSFPERSICSVYVVSPWPEDESLLETLWHEMTHAALSPITSQLAEHPSGVMLEEQIVERIGNLLARVPMAARKAITLAISKAPQVVRARISARSKWRARGGNIMDPNLFKEALDAIEAGDAAKAIEILKGLIVSAATGEAAHAEPDGDEMQIPGNEAAAKVEEMPPPAGTDGGYGGARVAARKGSEMNAEVLRAKKEALEFRDELAAIAKDQRGNAKETLLVGLRARLGEGLTPAIEKRILNARTYTQAKEVAEIATEMAGSAQVRARSEVEHKASPAGVQRGESEQKLLEEGFSHSWIGMYRAEVEHNPSSASFMLDAGRASLRARKAASNGKVS